jgi:hypothetical protein
MRTLPWHRCLGIPQTGERLSWLLARGGHGQAPFDQVARVRMTCDPWVTPDPRPVSTVQKMPHIVRAFFADPDLRYITA